MPSQKPSLLLLSFVYPPNIGGVESHLDELSSALESRGYRLTVLTYQPLRFPLVPLVEQAGNKTVIRIPWFHAGIYQVLAGTPLLQLAYLMPGLLIASCLYLIVNSRSTDIIQAHGFSMAIVGAVISKFFGIPYTVHTHVSFTLKPRTLYSRTLCSILNSASRILVLTEQAEQELVAIGVRRSLIRRYRYWVNSRFFSPLPKLQARKLCGFAPSDHIILFVGRLIPEKGIRLILDGAELVRARNVRFVLAGTGPMEHEVRDYVRGSRNVRFLGAVPRDQLSKYYCAADLTIIPSRTQNGTYSEGIPRVMIESLSCGTPVAATSAGGISNFLSPKIGYAIQDTSDDIARLANQLGAGTLQGAATKASCIGVAKEEFGLLKNLRVIEQTLLQISLIRGAGGASEVFLKKRD